MTSYISMLFFLQNPHTNVCCSVNIWLNQNVIWATVIQSKPGQASFPCLAPHWCAVVCCLCVCVQQEEQHHRCCRWEYDQLGPFPHIWRAGKTRGRSPAGVINFSPCLCFWSFFWAWKENKWQRWDFSGGTLFLHTQYWLKYWLINWLPLVLQGYGDNKPKSSTTAQEVKTLDGVYIEQVNIDGPDRLLKEKTTDTSWITECSCSHVLVSCPVSHWDLSHTQHHEYFDGPCCAHAHIK